MTTDPTKSGLGREIYRRRLLEARSAFVYGSETIEELAARFAVEKGDLTRMSRREGWPTLRKKKRDEMARALETRTAVSIVTRRAAFLGDAAEMLNSLGDLIKKELARIEANMPNAAGIPPTFADTKAVSESLLKYVQAGKVAFAIPDDIKPPGYAGAASADIIDLEPIGAAPTEDPFAIQQPQLPPSPLGKDTQ